MMNKKTSIIPIVFSLIFSFLFSFFLYSCENSMTETSEGTISSITQSDISKTEEETATNQSDLESSKENEEENATDDFVEDFTEDFVDNEEDEYDELIYSDMTLLVYMAADNNLESSAIIDINEMESANIPFGMTVLVLVDRAEGYDATNGDWTGTRLYKIQKDDSIGLSKINSERLSCEELNITLEHDIELDMAKKSTLSGFISYAKRKYPAQKYGLIIWGHGTGYRDSEILSNNTKSFALDSYSNSYMTISDLKEAIEKGLATQETISIEDNEDNAPNNKLSFIGFDTCFGMTIETLYEIKDIADFAMGSPSLESESGWDYSTFFSSLKSGFEVKDILSSAQNSFSKQYALYPSANFCVFDLSKTSSVVESFNALCSVVASKINTNDARNKYANLFQKKAILYKANNYPCDVYVDLKSIATLFPTIDESLSSASNNFLAKLDNAIVSSWSGLNGECSPGVFYATYKSNGIVSMTHPDDYINGTQNSSNAFVTYSSNYVPTKNHKGSLLDKLFYTNFN